MLEAIIASSFDNIRLEVFIADTFDNKWLEDLIAGIVVEYREAFVKYQDAFVEYLEALVEYQQTFLGYIMLMWYLIDRALLNGPTFFLTNSVKQNGTKIAVFGSSTRKAVEDKGLNVDSYAPSKKFPSMTMALDNYISQSNKK